MCALDNIQSIFEQILNTNTSQEIDCLLEDLFLARAYTVLENKLQDDKSFQESNIQIENKLENLKHHNLTCEQQNLIDDLLSACNLNSSEYGRNAYIQGFKDSVTLFMQLYSSVLFNHKEVK